MDHLEGLLSSMLKALHYTEKRFVDLANNMLLDCYDRVLIHARALV